MAFIDVGIVPHDGSLLRGYRAEPVGDPASAPTYKGALILIHEIWGLVDHITDVADRFAAEGYLVVAPDLLSGIGVPPEVGQELQDLTMSADEKTRTDAQPLLREKMAPARVPEYAAYAVSALATVVDYLTNQPGVDGRVAVTGFCFGGGYSFALAAADPRVKVAIPFYGMAPQGTLVGATVCPVLAVYGSEDPRLIDALPDLESSMAEAGVDFTAKVYPGAKHAFFNDTNPSSYDAEAATDAWKLSLSFLADHL